MFEEIKDPKLTPDEENDNDESSSDDEAHIGQNYIAIAWEHKIKHDDHDIDAEEELVEGKEVERKSFKERLAHIARRATEEWLDQKHKVQKELEDDFEHFRISKQHTRIDHHLGSWGETAKNLGPIERAIVAMVVLKAAHLHRHPDHFHKFLSESFGRIASKFEQHATTIATQYLKHSEWGTVYSIAQNLHTLSQLPPKDMQHLQQGAHQPQKMTPEEQAHINTLVNFVASQGQWQDRMMEPTTVRGPGAGI